jgi:S-adenosylmethionine:tRNA ribosyltransferase-isomerase
MNSTDNDRNLASYYYEVPAELIAQQPLPRRDESRLLVLDRAQGTCAHRTFSDLLEYLRAGDCLVVNRTRVVPVRLFGKKKTGGRVEVLFLDPQTLGSGQPCRVLLKPYIPAGEIIFFPGGLEAVVGEKTVQAETLVTLRGAAVEAVLEEHGRMPLPPYIKRSKDEDAAVMAFDRARYQTVYAKEKGAIAAPTAGLHFTPEFLERIQGIGVTVVEIVLHVGWGTFKPITAADVSEHRMLPERYIVSEESARTINAAKQRGNRVIAVGTTSVRTLESAAVPAPDGRYTLKPGTANTEIFIYPGYQFKIIDAMVTNLHLPHSTPLMMVSAFAGKERILAAYAEAVQQKYRFFSYGDAMIIL